MDVVSEPWMQSVNLAWLVALGPGIRTELAHTSSPRDGSDTVAVVPQSGPESRDRASQANSGINKIPHLGGYFRVEIGKNRAASVETTPHN